MSSRERQPLVAYGMTNLAMWAQHRDEGKESNNSQEDLWHLHYNRTRVWHGTATLTFKCRGKKKNTHSTAQNTHPDLKMASWLFPKTVTSCRAQLKCSDVQLKPNQTWLIDADKGCSLDPKRLNNNISWKLLPQSCETTFKVSFIHLFIQFQQTGGSATI